jgi:methionyl-tRNA synthetase
VNRTLVFINKSFEGIIPDGKMEKTIELELQNLYNIVGKKIENGELKEALEDSFYFIRSSNKYFDDQKPWIQIKEDIQGCKNTLYICTQIIANLSNLLSPFLPFACDRIRDFLNITEPNWNYIKIPNCTRINEVQILFERIDKKKIEQEVQNLDRSIHE